MSFIDYDSLIFFCNVIYGTIFWTYIQVAIADNKMSQFFLDFPILSEIKGLL